MPRGGREGGLDEAAVVVIEPVDVELARHLQHYRGAVELHRAQRAKPRFKCLARDMGLDLVKRALPHVTGHHRLHRRHVIPSSPSTHRVSTAYPHIYPQKNRGVTGIDRNRYAPTERIRSRISSQHVFPGERSASIRAGEDRLARTGSANGSGHALGLRDGRRVPSIVRSRATKIFATGIRRLRKAFALTRDAAIRYNPTLVFESFSYTVLEVTPREAHVSAAQSPPKEGARLPRAHEHARRPRCPEAPP